MERYAGHLLVGFFRFFTSRKSPLGALLGAALFGSLSLASAQTWTAATSGNWSNSANWSGGVPATSGATVTLNGTTTAVISTVDSAWAANGSVAGLTFNNGTGAFTLASGTGVTGFSIGSGGITTNSGTIGNINLNGNMTLSASQTWNLNSSTGYVGFENSAAVLNVGSGVTLTKSGTQTLQMDYGTSVFSGNFTLNNGAVKFTSSGQFNRLGNNITWQNTNSTANFLYNSPTAGAAVSANYIFSDIGANSFALNVGSNAAAGSMTFSGNWSSGSTLTHGINMGAATGVSNLNSGFSTAWTYIISGDNHLLTSSVASTASTGTFRIRNGIWVAGSATALGTNNGLSVSLGEYYDTRAGVVAGLWTNGYDVASAITTALNTNATPQSGVVMIGNSKTSGTATFSGPVTFTKSATAAQVPSVNLVSNIGSSANFTGNITDGGTGANVSAVSISGGGTVVLSGTNSYNGTTTVSAGVLNIQSATALGSTVGGTSVTASAALQIQNNITVGAEALTLNGSGISNDGALRNISGNNTYGGNITLGSATRINSDSGTLTLNSTTAISGATFGLTVGGAGNTTISSVIRTTNGTLTKDGAGTLTLSGNNSYTGATNVTAGTLLANNTIGSATGSGNVTVATGANLGGNGTIGGATTIAGIISPGDGGIGALNITGNVTWQGASSNGTATDWIFQLGASPTSDLLNITGNFTKDASTYGTNFRFNFEGATNTGTFKVVDWSGTSSFIASDFSYTNLGSGLTGSFSIIDSQLDFSVLPAVPEPSTWIAMAALIITGGTMGIRCRDNLKTELEPRISRINTKTQRGGIQKTFQSWKHGFHG